ncbi:MAG TPA: AAA family ATPase [Candidatus Binatia bacterium]|nr:AAA family ATPase [Candidatus Binatia bacterium]
MATAVASAELVGRVVEMRALLTALEDAAAQRGRVVVLAGEAGIGKTHLAEDLARRARERGFRALSGYGLATEGTPPFWPWTQVLRALLAEPDASDLLRELRDGIATVARLVPEIRTTEPAPPGAPLDAAQARFLLFDTVASLLRLAAASRPTLIVFDELHAADEPSLELLGFVAREIEQARLLLVGAVREPDLAEKRPAARLVRALSRQPFVKYIRLAGLDVAHLAELMRRSAGSDLSDSVVAAVHARTGGNPLFAKQLTTALRDARGGEPSDPARLPIPAEIREIVRRRLAGLGGREREVLSMAAVFGDAFDVPVLAEVVGESRDGLAAIVEGALAQGILGEVTAALGRHAFVHPVVREVLYAELPPAARRALHRRVAEALAARGGRGDGRLEAIADHFVRSLPDGPVEQAIDYARAAAESATARLAHEDAVRLHGQALAVLEASAIRDDERRCAVLLDLGEAQMRSTGTEEARVTLARAVDLAETIGNDDAVARGAIALSEVGLGTAGPVPDPGIVQRLESALRRVGAADSDRRAVLLARRSVYGSSSSQPDGREARSRRAVEMARRSGSATALGKCLLALHDALRVPGRAAERRKIGDEIIRGAAETADVELALNARALRFADLLELGDADALDREVDACCRLAAQSRQPRHLWVATHVRAVLAQVRGKPREAEALLREAAGHGRRAGHAYADAVFGVALHSVRHAQRRLAELEPLLAGHLEAFGESGRVSVANLWAEAGRLADAQRELDVFARAGFADVGPPYSRLVSLVQLAQVATAVGDATRAGELRALLEPHAHVNVLVLRVMPLYWGPAAFYCGILAATAGDRASALAHFDRARASCERLGDQVWLARVESERARVLIARALPGDGDAAARSARRASKLAGELDMPACADEVRQLAVASDRDAAATAGTGAANAAGCAGTPDNLFRRDGDHWTVRFDGTTVRVRDVKGLAHLSALLSSPGRSWPATDLFGTSLAEGAASSALQEQARLGVTKRIKLAIARIRAVHPALGRHLALSVTTGLHCSYDPSPAPVRWRT